MQGIPNVVVYLDDILISSKSEDHMQTLDRVLDCLESVRVTLKEAKCIF